LWQRGVDDEVALSCGLAQKLKVKVSIAHP
jgi:hypothetical protein